MKTRIRKIINIKADGNLKKFAEKCGVSQQTMTNAVKGVSCSADTIAAIVAACPDINANWLLTGNGEITRPFGLAYAEVQFLKSVVKTLEIAALIPKMTGEQVQRFQVAAAQGKMPEFSDEEINFLKNQS